MRLFKTLTRKLFRDIWKNFRQFISIIFIVGISVTLFVGLDANAQSFENRVNEVYKKGNIADEWITISPDFVNTEEMEADLTFIEEEAGVNSGGEVETRFYLPMSLGSTSANALIMDKLPTINTPYNLDVIYYDNNSFFFVDQGFVKRYEENNNVTFSLGDSLPVNIDSSFIKQAISSIANDPESLNTLISKLLDSANLNQNIRDIILNITNNYSSEIGSLIDGLVSTIFSEQTIEINLKVNGIMSHPENMDSGEFSTTNFLLSTRLLLNNVVEYLGDKFSSSVLLSEINSFLETNDNQLLEYLLTLVRDYLSDETNALQIDAAIMVLLNSFESEITSRTNADIESFIASFYNQILVKLEPNVEISVFETNIKNYYDSKENNNLLAALSRSNYPSMISIENDINQAKQLTLVFPIIFFVVSLLIVLTTISSLILKDRVQIGTFKALGIKTRNIAFYYLAQMNIVTIIGVLIGFIVGPLLLPFVMNIKYSILYSIPSLTYYFPFLTAFIVLLIIVVLVSGLTLLLLFSELKLMPSESMRTKSPKIRKFKAHKHLIKNTSFMMAIRNIKVHIVKSLMVIIGVMGCTGLLICGMGIDDTINYGKDSDLAQFYDSDMSVSFNGSPLINEAKNELLTYDGVETVEEYTTLTANLNAEDRSVSSAIYGISKDSLFFKFDDELEGGNWVENGVALTQSKADDLGVELGDTITFDINGTIYRKEVVYIFYAFFVNGAYLYVESEPELFTYSSAAWINVKNDEDPNLIKENILNNSKIVYTCLTKDEMNERISGYMSSIGMMTNTIKVFAILLAVVVLINLSILNYNERLRELATLKVLGFSRTKIVFSLLIEMLILTVIGALLGLTIGLPMEYIVLSVNETPLVSWLYLVLPQTYVISFFLSLVTAFVVNLFMFFKVDKISMSESLKSVDE